MTEEIPYRHTLVQGVPVPGIINPDLVADLQSFEFKDGDVVVASYQKAGQSIVWGRVLGINCIFGRGPKGQIFYTT